MRYQSLVTAPAAANVTVRSQLRDNPAAVNRLRVLAARAAWLLPRFRGKGRALRSLDAWLRRARPNATRLRLAVGGVNYELNTEDLIDFNIAYLGAHDRAVTEFLSSQIAPRGTILWDVGANVGSISLPLVHRHPTLRVEAFEPSPPVIARLRRNIALNPLLAGRILVHEAALCDRDGSVDFYVSAEPENSGVGTLVKSANTQTEPVRVSACSGDAVIRRGTAAPPDLIKMDVEGFEYEVLVGLQTHLKARAHVVILFEHEPYRLQARHQAVSAIQALQAMGFALFVCCEFGRLEPVQPHMLERHCDLVALRT